MDYDLDSVEKFRQYIYFQIEGAKINEEDKDVLNGLAQNLISIYTDAIYESNGFCYL